MMRERFRLGTVQQSLACETLRTCATARQYRDRVLLSSSGNRIVSDIKQNNKRMARSRRRSISVSELLEDTVVTAERIAGRVSLPRDLIVDAADGALRLATARKLFLSAMITAEELAVVQTRLRQVQS